MTVTSGLAAAALYTGLLTFVLLWLGFHVSQKRRRLRISIGDAGNPEMLRAMRGQANFVENAPMAVIILYGMAFFDAPVLLIHFLGALLVIGRILHAMHFTRDDAPVWQRASGAALTAFVLFIGALGLVGHGLAHL